MKDVEVQHDEFLLEGKIVVTYCERQDREAGTSFGHVDVEIHLYRMEPEETLFATNKRGHPLHRPEFIAPFIRQIAGEWYDEAMKD